MSIGRYKITNQSDQIKARIDAQKEAARREQARRQASAPRWIPEFRGSALELQDLPGKQFEVMLSGPAETGKTYAACYLLDNLLRRYSGAQGVLGRKIRATIVGSVLQTYLRVAQQQGPIAIYGGNDPQWIDYANGSRLWIIGLDKPGNVLSSERDIIYINQSEELSANDWEVLSTRATGRAGNMPFSMLLGDCNPASASHWITRRKALLLLKSYHKDNPVLFRNDGTITEQGERSLAILANLSEPRRSRLFLGLWASAEGQVYSQFDPAKHVVPRYDIPLDWPRIRVIDFGYKNPFVCSWYAIQPNTRKLIRYREIYRTNRLVEDHAADIGLAEGWIYNPEDQYYTWLKPITQRENIIATICDHDAEDRATLERHGVKDTIPATKYIKLGIEAVQQRLKLDLLEYLEDSLINVDPELDALHLPKCTEDEFEGYVYPEGKDGKPNKELPVDNLNHGMDTTRYAVAFVDDLGIELEDRQETITYVPDYEISPI